MKPDHSALKKSIFKIKMTIGFIGVGKISSALVEGLCTSVARDIHIFLSPRSEINARQLATRYSQVQRLETNQQVIDRSQIVFIAVRPAIANEVLAELSFRADQTIVSLIPLMKKEEISHAVAPARHIVRAVPTPTVLQHTGPILMLDPTDEVLQLFSWLGEPVIVNNEQQLHVLWTLTGLITPFYDLLQELTNWSTDNGADPLAARAYIAGFFQALALAAQQDKTVEFKNLSRHAETPNGLNEQAGREIREKGVHQAYRMAADNLLKRFE